MREAPFWKEHSLGMLALRIFLGDLGLALGLLVFSFYPRVLSHPYWVMFWIVILAISGILLHQYSERIGHQLTMSRKAEYK
jgi:hypothetical protein